MSTVEKEKTRTSLRGDYSSITGALPLHQIFIRAYSSIKNHHRLLLWAMIAFSTAFSICDQGYNFGDNDHSIYVPYLKSINDPGLYQKDLMLQTWRQVYFARIWGRILALIVQVIP